jgi:hypothetical protein
MRAKRKTLKLAREAVAPERDLLLAFRGTTGTLVLEGLTLESPSVPERSTTVLLHDGVAVSARMLSMFADRPDGTADDERSVKIALRGVESGIYRLCVVDRQRFLDNEPLAPDGDCVTGTLAAGGELALSSPAKKGANWITRPMRSIAGRSLLSFHRDSPLPAGRSLEVGLDRGPPFSAP